MDEKTKREERYELIEAIKEELEPVIEHLLDLGHDLAANHLLHIRDRIVPEFEKIA